MADRRFWKYSEILLWRMYFKMNMAGGQISEHSETIANEKWCDRTLGLGGILATTPAGVAFSSGRGWKVRTHFNYSCLTAGLTVLAQLRRLRIPHTPRRPLFSLCFETWPGAYLSQVFLCIAAGQQNISAASVAVAPRTTPGHSRRAQLSAPMPRSSCFVPPLPLPLPMPMPAVLVLLLLLQSLWSWCRTKFHFVWPRGAAFYALSLTQTRTLVHPLTHTEAVAPTHWCQLYMHPHTGIHMAKGNKNKQALIFTIIENRPYRDVPHDECNFWVKLVYALAKKYFQILIYFRVFH